MENIKKIIVGILSVALVLGVLHILPKEEKIEGNVRIAASNDSSGLVLHYMIENKDKSGKIRNLDVESYIIGDC